MLRHLREKHKMQRDDPNYPVNQRVVFSDKGKDRGDVGCDPEPTQGHEKIIDTVFKKVCVKYQNVGNEKIIDMVREKSMVSRSGSVVLSVKRSTCVVSGCVITFSRNYDMLRHLREKHKMQRDNPNYPGNQSVVFGDKGKDGGDLGGDSEPSQDQDTEGEDIEVGDDSEPAQEPEPSKQKNKRSQRKRRDVKSPRKTKEDKKRERERLERKKSQERRNLKFEKSKKKNSNINIDVKGCENDVVVGVVSCMNDDYDLCPQLYCINCIKHLREDHDSQEVNDPSAGSLIVDMDVDLQSQSEHSEYRCTEEGCTVVYMDRYQLSYHLKKKHSHLIKQDWMDTSQDIEDIEDIADSTENIKNKGIELLPTGPEKIKEIIDARKDLENNAPGLKDTSEKTGHAKKDLGADEDTQLQQLSKSELGLLLQKTVAKQKQIIDFLAQVSVAMANKPDA